MSDKKPKIQKEEIPMSKQSPKERVHNFEEVAYGYNEEEVLAEANRCLNCKTAPCVKKCPVQIDIPAFITLIKEKKFEKSIQKIKEKNSLPAICGRVCPQEEQCQSTCTVGRIGAPVSIGRLERYVADWEREHGLKLPKKAAKTGKHIAIVGAGPAGLTAAADLVKQGHDITIFEALHKPGGVVVYGIPEFRLPKAIVYAEADYIEKLGVKIKMNSIIGQVATIKELLKTFDAIFIGTGAGLPRFMGIPGENLCGVYSANEFLIRVNLMKGFSFPDYDTPVDVGEKVAVIGGGNVAMDAARCALRLGAKEVRIVYRRAREQMPARNEEIENAEEEGIIFNLLVNPIRFIGDERGWVKGIECIKMKLGEPDESGRRRPEPVPNSEFVMNMDTIIVSIGNRPNPIIQQTTKGLEVTKWGTIAVDENGKTSIDGVYAGGDIVTGAATVISAMEAGKRAASSMHNYVMEKK